MSLLTPLLRTDALTAVFSDEQLVQGMLDFEAALAKAQARCGIIPHEAVEPIVAACQAQRLDFRRSPRRRRMLAIWRFPW